MYYAFVPQERAKGNVTGHTQPRKGTWLAWPAPKSLDPSPLKKAGFSFLGLVCLLAHFRLILGDALISCSSFSGAFPMLKCTLFEPSSTLLNSLLSSQVLSVRLLVFKVLEVQTSTTSLWRFSCTTWGEGALFSEPREIFRILWYWFWFW